MEKKILVTSANGNVGFPTVVELLKLGFRVRAFVRSSESSGSKELKKLGAELFIGDLNDITDVRNALNGVQNAFFCAPGTNYHLSKVVAFVHAAEEAKIEHVVYLTQWLSSENHLSSHSREHWLGDQVIKMHKDVQYTIVNPGLFAYTYFLAAPVIAHFGMLPTPIKGASTGKVGLNAPPSEQDQGRVIANILKNPSPHHGKTYRPTGPKLISYVDAADIMGEILGKEVKVAEATKSRFLKSLNSADVPKEMREFMLINVPYYMDELEQNSFAHGSMAVTSVVKDLTGKEPEDFETIARRYLLNAPDLKPNFSNKMKAFKGFLKIIFSKEPSISKIENSYGIPSLKKGFKYVQENPNWVEEHA
ncbi:MAG: NAD(P)H dehydrogenase (quinone) [Crocinitomicaceae bacterium]|jgi:NAD(P)H dehydrogenase (quinone)